MSRKRGTRHLRARSHPRPVPGVLVNGLPFVILVGDDECPICAGTAAPTWRAWEPDVECLTRSKSIHPSAHGLEKAAQNEEEAPAPTEAPSGPPLSASGGSRNGSDGSP